jgi:uncharacterized Zn-binding protein involved in type VI secretion
MRSKRSTFRQCLIALLAVFALAALVASAAQAAETEGPFWRVPCHKVSAANKGLGAFGEEGCKTAGGSKEWSTRLLGGETSETTAKASKSFVFKCLGCFGLFVTCKHLSVKGAKALGSSGANPGTREETITFEGCTVAGYGETCKVENEKISFEAATYESGYEQQERHGKLFALLRPKTGVVFTKIKLTGECTLSSLTLEGSLAGEVWSGGKAVEAGKEPAGTVVDEVNFPEVVKNTIWVEKEGAIQEVKPSLKIAGAPVRVEGREEVELLSKQPFGVFTK